MRGVGGVEERKWSEKGVGECRDGKAVGEKFRGWRCPLSPTLACAREVPGL